MSRINGSSRVRYTLVAVAGLAIGFGLPVSAQEDTKPAQVKPAETKQPEKEPARQVPAGVKPGEAKPVDPANQPSEIKPGVIPGANPGGTLPGQQSLAPSPLRFDSGVEHDWGTIDDSQKVSHTFKFTNTSDKPVKITASASCGCTVAALAKDTYAPGESGEIGASFDPHGRPGPQTKNITVTIIDPPGQFQQTALTIRCNVKAMVLVEPNKVFAQEVDHRTGNTQRVVVTGRKQGFQILAAETNHPQTKAIVGQPRQVTIDGDVVTQYDVDLQILPGAPIGNLQAQMTLRTNEDRVQVQPLFFGGDVVGDVRCTPANAFFHSVIPNTPFSTQMRLDNKAGTAFKITNIEVEPGQGSDRASLVVDIDQMGEGEGMYYIVKVAGIGPSDAALVTGALLITTNHENETIRVPFTGSVRLRGSSAQAK
jgi:hypothetical protein